MNEDQKPRPRLGPKALKLAESLTGVASSEGLEAGITALEAAADRAPINRAGEASVALGRNELKAIHDSLCIIQLMLLESAASRPEETQRTMAEFARFSAKRQRSALIGDSEQSARGDLLNDRLMRTEQLENARELHGPERTDNGERGR